MSHVYNKQCDVQNTDHNTLTSTLTQPPFKFWSSADHWEFNYGSKQLI